MGWAYNTVGDPPNDTSTILGVALTFTAFSLILVVVRWYVRIMIVKAPGWDDILIVVSWLGSCGYTVATVFETKWGLGLLHISDMPPQNLYNFQLCQYIGAPFYVLGIYGFKMSLLLSYLRFVPRPYDIVSKCLIVVISMAHIGFLCGFLFLCNPIRKQWDPSVTWGHCINGLPFYMAFSSLTIIFDVTVMLLPFPVLLTSKIQKRRKIALLALFALGLFVTIIQIIRIQTIKNLVNYLDSSTSIVWSIIETNIGITITCVPTLAPMIKYYADKGRGSGNASNQKAAGGPDSRYAMQSWRGRSGRKGSGMGSFTSMNDADCDDNEDTGVSSRSTRFRNQHEEGSTENILSPANESITKTTDVIVSHQTISDANQWDKSSF